MLGIIRFYRDEDGGIIPFSLILVVLFFIVGGIAVDVSNAYQSRTQLQVAADSAAHAALMTREFYPQDEAQAKGVEIAKGAMPDGSYGGVIQAEDIQFGFWDEDAEVFTYSSGSRMAVLVDTARISARNNPEPTYFLKFIGLNKWDIRSQSVFVTYYPTCLSEGIVGEDVVDVQSNNLYIEGYCVHSNTLVSLNSNNVFQDNTIVSMPDVRDLDGPSDMFDSNEGLEAALRDGSYKLRILQRIQDIYEGVQTTNDVYSRDYINSSSIIDLKRNQKLDGSVFTPGRIHRIWCTSQNQHANIHNGTALSQVVIITNCKMNFGQGVSLEDAVVVNLNTSDNSFGAASGVRLGRDDNCATGGGAQLVTMGGLEVPADLQMYGGQIIAQKDIAFTSNADGIQGASFVAGGRVDATTNGVMGFCGNGMEDNFEAAYFRMAF
ncbi:Tad domain-containing protein [Psychromarinibacter sp. C21-152]|uniref:Tad domain-containing protein n=1 Tax=Psychromarinibacter sediminicola TaxID=3033385 RepID=A0AAE3TCD7_9RHOB|nr:Tad domain-containing protein [Psychromarinibacter sediminicola]MDF0603864.1 Tad domain-containing protein [Psychromarinibacter sediminicola]